MGDVHADLLQANARLDARDLGQRLRQRQVIDGREAVAGGDINVLRGYGSAVHRAENTSWEVRAHRIEQFSACRLYVELGQEVGLCLSYPLPGLLYLQPG